MIKISDLDAGERGDGFPVAVMVSAAVYYVVLAATEFTWIFSSGDSGGWLTSFVSWQTPQPFGNPLYVLLGHLLNWFPGDLVTKVTLIGSCLASAVTVMMVYLIVHGLSGSRASALVASGVLLASAVFLSQSTVLSQYPLAILMTVLAVWFYMIDKKWAAVLFIGLGTAMHFVNGVVAVLWLAVEWRSGNLRGWLKWIPLYFVVGVLPYSLTLWELWNENGTLSLAILSSFISNTSGAGGLMIMELPMRLLKFLGFVVASLGVALIPVVYGWRAGKIRGYRLLLVPVLFVSWYYLTAQDPTVWHYLPWIMPFLAILAGVGFESYLKWKPAPVLLSLWIGVMLVVNALMLNANLLASEDPRAVTLYNNLKGLPENSVIESERVGWVGFTVRYVLAADRPDIRRVDPGAHCAFDNSIYVVSAEDGSITEVTPQ